MDILVSQSFHRLPSELFNMLFFLNRNQQTHCPLCRGLIQTCCRGDSCDAHQTCTESTLMCTGVTVCPSWESPQLKHNVMLRSVCLSAEEVTLYGLIPVQLRTCLTVTVHLYWSAFKVQRGWSPLTFCNSLTFNLVPPAGQMLYLSVT